MSAEIEQLRRLMRLGFRAQQIVATDGHCEALFLWRELSRVAREGVVVYPDYEVLAFRTLASGFDISRPFAVPARTLLWVESGDLVSTTHQLLIQPWPAGALAAACTHPEYQ